MNNQEETMSTSYNHTINALRDEIVKYGNKENLEKFNSQSGQDPKSSSEGVFTRNRKMPLRDLLEFMIWPKAESMAVELLNYSELIGKDNVTKNDFSCRRKDIPYGYIKSLNKSIAQSYYTENDKIDTWHGHALFAADGSTYSLPSTEEMKESFMEGRKSGLTDQPLARGVVLKDVLNGLIIGSNMEGYGRDEIKLLIEETQYVFALIVTLSPVFILDRKFCAYTLISKLVSLKIDFIIRVKGKFNKDVDDFVASGKDEQVVTLYPGSATVKKLKRLYGADTKTDGFTVKLVRLKNGIVVMTSLLNESLDADDGSEIYHKRWDDESTIGFVKNNLQIEIFSGKSQNCILQDFYSKIVTYNLLSGMVEQAAKMRQASISDKETKKADKGRKKYQINMNIALGILKLYMPQYLHNEADFNTILTKMLKQMARHTTAVIPGRHNPRVFRKIKHNGKYITLTNYARAI